MSMDKILWLMMDLSCKAPFISNGVSLKVHFVLVKL